MALCGSGPSFSTTAASKVAPQVLKSFEGDLRLQGHDIQILIELAGANQFRRGRNGGCGYRGLKNQAGNLTR